MDWNKTSKRDFEKVLEKQVQERWYKVSQLSKESRTEVESIEKTHKQNLARELFDQEKHYQRDVQREFEYLLEKQKLELHRHPPGLISQEDLRKISEHNVTMRNREVVFRMEEQHAINVEALLNKEGLYLNKGNSQLQLPSHFNERSGRNNQENGRGR